MALQGLMKDRVTLVKQNGERFDGIRALISGAVIHTDDEKLPVEEGDKIERALPNGLTETYLVLDRGFMAGFRGIPNHYQMKVRKESALPRRPSGPTIYNISGANARVNINSTDLSANVVNVTPDKLFDALRRVIEEQVMEDAKKRTLTRSVEAMQRTNGSSEFVEHYQVFISAVADHLTIFSAFIPALSQMLQ